MAGRGRPGPFPAPSGGAALHGPALHLTVEGTPIMRLARTLDNSAWLPGVYGAVYRANLRIVREVQERAVQNLKESIVRPEQRTGQLEQAISSPEAVYADGSRIVVGVGDYLDAHASYWRPVEAGAPGLQGRVMFGFWTRAPRFDRGRVGLEGPIGGERTGRPIVLSWDTPPEGVKRYFMWTMEHPIQAHFYFLDAWNEVGRSGFMEEAYRQEFATATGPNGKPLRLNEQFRAYHGRPVLGSDFRL